MHDTRQVQQYPLTSSALLYGRAQSRQHPNLTLQTQKPQVCVDYTAQDRHTSMNCVRQADVMPHSDDKPLAAPDQHFQSQQLSSAH